VPKNLLFIMFGMIIGHFGSSLWEKYENRLTLEQKEVIAYLKRSQELV